MEKYFSISRVCARIGLVLHPPRTLPEATRILRGLTQSELATALGISQSMVSLLEAGKQRASAALVTSLAAALDMPEGLLRRPSPAPYTGHLLRPSLPRATRNAALSEVTMAHAHIDLLLAPSPADLVPAPENLDPVELAQELRERWDVQPGPISGMIPLLEEHGIVCVYRDLSDLGVPALASTAKSGRTLMFVDIAASRTDIAWSLAHELGHLVMPADPSKQSDMRADRFATAFLLPETDVRADHAFGSTLAYASRYGVRPRLLAQRLRDLKLVTHAQFRQLVHDTAEMPRSEAAAALLGSPSALADRVRDLGGSRQAAPLAFLTPEELRRRYLARSQT